MTLRLHQKFPAQMSETKRVNIVTEMILMWIPNRNPAGGLGPSGVQGSAPEIFEIYGFFHLREPILADFRELFMFFLLQKFSANERPVCNM